MAGEEVFGNAASGQRALAASLFLGGVYASLDAMSTLNSSPWTAESFGGDPEKEASLREYVTHALAVSSTASVISAGIAGPGLWWAPIVGTLLINVYLYWLYRRAVARARERGSTDWET